MFIMPGLYAVCIVYDNSNSVDLELYTGSYEACLSYVDRMPAIGQVHEYDYIKAHDVHVLACR